MLNDIPSLWPIIKGDGIISLHFGPAIEPFTRQWYIHKGIDLAGVRIGTAIVAAADGRLLELVINQRVMVILFKLSISMDFQLFMHICLA